MKRSETAIPKLRTNSDGSKTWWYEWRQDGQHRSLVVGDGSRSRTWATRELRTLFSRLEKAEAERAVSGFSSRSTVKEMAARWLDASESGWAKNTAAAMRSAVRAHILPAIGDKPVGDVRAFDVQAIYVRRTSQTAVSDARHLRARGRACCDQCERWFPAEEICELSTALEEGRYCDLCAMKAMARARRAAGASPDNPTPPNECPSCGADDLGTIRRLEGVYFHCATCRGEFVAESFGPASDLINSKGVSQ